VLLAARGSAVAVRTAVRSGALSASPVTVFALSVERHLCAA